MKLIKKFFLTLAVLAMVGAAGTPSLATDFIVMSVVRDFPMKTGDTMYKDFYVNAGSNNGLRKGLFLEATRKMPAYDNMNSKLGGDTSVKIARLRLIHVDKNISVARLVKFYEKEITPLSGVDSVMIGDFIEVAEKQ
jgi:hypothetical protein